MRSDGLCMRVRVWLLVTRHLWKRIVVSLAKGYGWSLKARRRAMTEVMTHG